MTTVLERAGDDLADGAGGGVSAVVVTWNSSRHIRSLARHLLPAMTAIGSSSIVVVDNGSTDDTLDVVRQELPGATVVELSRNTGYAAGVNAGIAVAPDDDDVLVLNPDVEVDREMLGRLLAAVRDERVGIAVPRLHDSAGALSPSLRREPTLQRAVGEMLVGGVRAGRRPHWGEMVTGAASYEHDQDVDWATGAVMLVSRQCLRAVGEWDESFFLYSEETDFALRARDAGFMVRYVSDAAAVHEGGEVMTSGPLLALMLRNKVRLFRRRHGLVEAVALYAVTLLTCVSRAAHGDRAQRYAVAALLGVRPVAQPERARGDGFVCF